MHLPIAKVITCVETKFILPLEMEKKLTNELGEPLDTPKNVALKIFQICK
jgi:hypothetical protein